MTKVFDILGFVAELHAIDRDMHELGPVIIRKACQMVQRRAKAAIGRGHEMWPPLAPSTIADKAAKGFPTPKPLLRTGELRDSIEYVVHGNEGAVGSNLEVAVWQELGTSKIPPRSFLVSSASEVEPRIHRMAAAATLSILSGHGRGVRDVRELVRIIREVAHVVHEQFDDLLEEGEDPYNGGRK
ncbi:hypothetical protein CK489_29100 [Bradyrhizobium sp. UFLA03-84]|uniref:hypothetical protein n=1 Tax=Bradyrhizobium sp. UFLA03-84 TaxID=418599 RepID=UPI000BAE3948|nr:hypothetical protein [Bradyrhizobium sp. UFLA03-84]PAY05443.1 hypothetical protein CK489_29100 [Bradyrhizobium sp. UFLA03-84]